MTQVLTLIGSMCIPWRHYIIYNKPTRYNSGSTVFINNYKYALHVSDALCVHHQWLLLQFIVLLMMDAKGVRNMQSKPVVVNEHSTARGASCWFIIYYRLVMHGNSNIKKKPTFSFTTFSEPQNTLYQGRITG